jgi:hypothetical protein
MLEVIAQYILQDYEENHEKFQRVYSVFLSSFKLGITRGPNCYLLTNFVLFKDNLRVNFDGKVRGRIHCTHSALGLTGTF